MVKHTQTSNNSSAIYRRIVLCDWPLSGWHLKKVNADSKQKFRTLWFFVIYPGKFVFNLSRTDLGRREGLHKTWGTMKKCENKNSTFHYLKIFLKCTGRERLVISFCYYSHRGSFGKTRSTFSSIHKTNRREGIFSRAEGSTTIVPILTKHQYQ